MHTRSITCFQSKQFCDQFPNLDWSVKHKVANLLCFCYYIYCDCCLNFGSIYALTRLFSCRLFGGQWILVYFSNIILICLIFFITAILHVWSLICNTYSVSNHFFLRPFITTRYRLCRHDLSHRNKSKDKNGITKTSVYIKKVGEKILYQPVRLAKIYARPLQNNKTSVKRIQPQLDFKNSYKSRRLKYEKYNFFSNTVFSKSEYHISPEYSTFKLINKVYLIHFVAVEFSFTRHTLEQQCMYFSRVGLR